MKLNKKINLKFCVENIPVETQKFGDQLFDLLFCLFENDLQIKRIENKFFTFVFLFFFFFFNFFSFPFLVFFLNLSLSFLFFLLGRTCDTLDLFASLLFQSPSDKP